MPPVTLNVPRQQPYAGGDEKSNQSQCTTPPERVTGLWQGQLSIKFTMPSKEAQTTMSVTMRR